MSKIYPLHALTTRETNDTAIALMDAWATVADVLTFYQERIANEGYLRTATERRSILELARLIGYALRPGVASTVYLAYTLDEDHSVTPPKPTAVTIPAGARVQSVPGPGELPQSFETADNLEARSQWNVLQVRLTQPQTQPSILEGKDQDSPGPRVYLKGISTNLIPNDAILIDFGAGTAEAFHIIAVIADAEADRTCVSLRPWVRTQQSVMNLGELARRFQEVDKFDVDPTTAMGKRVLALLQELEIKFTTASTTEVMDVLERTVMPELAREHQIAKSNQFTKLEPWLGQMIEGLDVARQELARNGALEGTTASDIAVSAGLTRSATTAGEEKKDLLRGGILNALRIPPSIPPPSPTRLGRNLGASFSGKSDTSLNLLASLQPVVRDTLSTALAHAKVTRDSGIKVYAFRVKAAPFGNNAPQRTRVERDSGEVTVIGEWPIIEWPTKNGEIASSKQPIPHESKDVIYLDTSYDKIAPDSPSQRSWIVFDFGAWTNPADIHNPQVRPVPRQPLITNVKAVEANISRADYGLTSKTTRIELADAWLSISPASQPNDMQALYDADFQVIRRSTVYAQSEELALAEEPIVADICGGTDEPIELKGFYSDLQSGRWLILSGERTDIKNDEGVVVPGVRASELLMLAGVTQDVKKIPAGPHDPQDLPGDRTHTFIRLAEKLSYCYKRDTVTIYGNVVKATHGETRNEVLGGGDGSKALQQFTLKQPPLTFISASNPSGVDSTLQVRINDVLWHETDSLAGLSPTDRKFITRTDDEGKTTVIFGNGHEGARLPTSQENVKAVYRNGIGKSGNVKAGQITLLATRPLGVKEVTNPLRASGGADKENRDQARQNAPLAVMSLDRLVSTQDYADFARTFAGIGKASAVRLSDGRRQLVQVTVAGADDIPIEKTSDLYRNLVKALRDFGDPYLPIRVDVRELLALVIGANVHVLPDYLWENVEPKIRAALLDEFGFQRRELGQAVFLSEVLSAIQRIPGIAYVDVDVLTTISEVELSIPDLLKNKIDELTAAARPEPSVPVRLAETTMQTKDDRPTSTSVGGIYPAQLACLTPDVPDTLILNEVTR